MHLKFFDIFFLAENITKINIFVVSAKRQRWRDRDRLGSFDWFHERSV